MNEGRSRNRSSLSSLHDFTRDLTAASDINAILRAIISHTGRTFGRAAAVWLPYPDGSLAPGATSPGLNPSPQEQAAAEQAFGLARGHGVQAPGPACYLALETPRGVVGVLGLLGEDACSVLTAGQRRLLEMFAGQAALAIERAQLAEHAQQAQVLRETERLQSSLLHSVSHDLRTPLAIITVALSNLEAAAERGDLDTSLNLARLGRQEVERLDRLVDNLLDLSRIEGGALRISATPCDVEELIGATLDRLAPELDEVAAEPLSAGGLLQMDPRWVLIEAPPGLSVPMDEALMVQALANVVENAAKYSPEGEQVDISARVVDDWVEISVADRGPGLPREDLQRIFDKFYRAQRPEGVPGAGLGLAISKGIVEAHGGQIWASRRPGGGTVVTLTLPLQAPPATRGG